MICALIIVICCLVFFTKGSTLWRHAMWLVVVWRRIAKRRSYTWWRSTSLTWNSHWLSMNLPMQSGSSPLESPQGWMGRLQNFKRLSGFDLCVVGPPRNFWLGTPIKMWPGMYEELVSKLILQIKRGTGYHAKSIKLIVRWITSSHHEKALDRVDPDFIFRMPLFYIACIKLQYTDVHSKLKINSYNTRKAFPCK